MPIDLPQSDLNRTISHEPSQSWPDKIEIVAVWGHRRRKIEISASQFFGINGHGAPMSGEQLIAAVDRLRRQGPKK